MAHMDYTGAGGCGSSGSGHMTPMADADCASCGCGRIVTYTANGLEANGGIDFRVPIGTTLAAADYEVGLLGITAGNLPIPLFPNGAGDRTAIDFRVQTAAPVALGDVLKFLLLE